MIPNKFQSLERADLICKRCGTPHYLRAGITNGSWWAVYDRDTRRYPSEFYGDNEFPVITFKKSIWIREDDDSPYPDRGPIVVFKRKRLTPKEVRHVWLSSRKRCHLCGKVWKLTERAKSGWHVDHLIPNIGGGKDTEMMENFRVACASCNLRKGRGYTPRIVREALEDLFKQNT